MTFPEISAKRESYRWATGRSRSVGRDSATSPTAPTRSQAGEGCWGNLKSCQNHTLLGLKPINFSILIYLRYCLSFVAFPIIRVTTLTSSLNVVKEGKKKKNIFALSLFNDATGHRCWVTVFSCHMQHKCRDVRLSQHIVSSYKDHNIRVLETRKVLQSDMESRRRYSSAHEKYM